MLDFQNNINNYAKSLILQNNLTGDAAAALDQTTFNVTYTDGSSITQASVTVHACMQLPNGDASTAAGYENNSIVCSNGSVQMGFLALTQTRILLCDGTFSTTGLGQAQYRTYDPSNGYSEWINLGHNPASCMCNGFFSGSCKWGSKNY